MRSTPLEVPRLALEFEPSPLRAGDTFAGTVLVDVAAPCTLSELAVTVNQAVITKTATRLAGLAYRWPLERPAGRTRSGSIRRQTMVELDLAPPTLPLGAGQHRLRFAGALPAETAASYRGLAVAVEHEAVVRAAFNGKRAAPLWHPLHVWAQPAGATGIQPVQASARSKNGSLGIAFRLPGDVLDIAAPLIIDWRVDNATGTRLGHLTFDLVAVETSRHGAATDVHETVAGSKRLALSAGGLLSDRLEWAMPRFVAPSMRGDRYVLEWRLDGRLTLPFALGVTASAPVVLADGIVAAAAEPEVEREKE